MDLEPSRNHVRLRLEEEKGILGFSGKGKLEESSLRKLRPPKEFQVKQPFGGDCPIYKGHVMRVFNRFLEFPSHRLGIVSRDMTSMLRVSHPVGTMSFPNGFDETDASFDFDAKTFNNVRETSSMDDMSDTSQLSISTPRRRQHSKNLELERYVHQNGKILISIALGCDKSISPHVIG
ncbi:(R)-mandelonitrile lyase 1-like [Cucumis melo var. makuwa]|uniref:(R)-mandelonitrile lyase 1-like n=1 Tax=Cucumis melo var. makuwa TaxID=1194695 RepID=A0A5A7SUE4_CUCMM|nr:(R)-mandelonitrile lyase 1-like [Cucumis melo var. makuwa]